MKNPSVSSACPVRDKEIAQCETMNEKLRMPPRPLRALCELMNRKFGIDLFGNRQGKKEGTPFTWCTLRANHPTMAFDDFFANC